MDSSRIFIWRGPTTCPPNRPLRTWRFDGQGRHHVEYGHKHLHILERGTVTAMRYRNEISDPNTRLFMGVVGPDFILMDDSVGPHLLQMGWPDRSPDLIPIGYAWDALGRATRNLPPSKV
ncbi:transposable element Tcb2 transposase [Trichonephila clavipes]|nr:transposable element Tcb2 transposase [Trichonephila clavipes]